MSKPRVKVYGFLSLTKRQYLLSLVLGLVLLTAFFIYWFTQGVQQLQALATNEKKQPDHWIASLVIPLIPYLPLVLIAAVALEAIEVLIVLGKFRRLEAAEREKRGAP